MSKTYEPVDIEMIVKAQGGDQDAFSAIYKKYYKNVYYICCQYFHNGNEAEDATQDTFTSIFKYIKTLETPETFFVWMSRIAYNCCNAVYRKNRKDAISYTNKSDDEFIYDEICQNEKNDQVAEIAQKEAVKVVRQTLNDMKPEFRILGYLYFFEQLSYKEISQVTQVTVGTVSSRVNRIKTKLKKALEQNKFTKESCMSLVLMPNMINLYREYVSSTPVSAPKAFHAGLFSSTAHATTATSALPLLSKVVMAATVLVPSSLVVYQNVEPFIHSSNIAQVTYQTQLTNQPVLINATIEGEDYDMVTLDDGNDMKVYRNGLHQIKLHKGDKVIDTYDFEINNIDIEAPDVKEQDFHNQVELSFNDHNGIDYAAIQISADDEVSYELIKEENKIIIVKERPNNVHVKIPDMAGNKTLVDVTFTNAQ